MRRGRAIAVFDAKCEALFAALGAGRIMVLATCAGGRVTARSVSVVVSGGKFYFQTDRSFLKYRQLLENRNAALCLDNIQVEGTSAEKGHPLDVENRLFAEQYQRCFPGSFEKYTAMKNETVFEISPTLITVWNYEDGKPTREFYDFRNNTYSKAYYDNSGIL
jgi:nitroimidazol reductase NimA-like FMN-containing flavoprotein (pyridoxamine 5'-phosphate oxidase superfamily)